MQPHIPEFNQGSEIEGGEGKAWIRLFLDTRGHEYYCEIDKEYILDRFNLTGLNAEIHEYYNEAINLITDCLDDTSYDTQTMDCIETKANHLYGLIHARYVITIRGLEKMLDKYNRAEFDKCPRVLCNEQPLLPVGLTDEASKKHVKLYCPRCEDIYNPKSVRHATIDGAYFGTSFPHILFQFYPTILPKKLNQRYEPRIFGFKIHDIANEHRWQDKAKQDFDKAAAAAKEEEGKKQ